jgi:hypothetical protein
LKRSGIAVVASVLAGTGLFVLLFGAVFSGLWVVTAGAALLYGLAAAVAVRAGGVSAQSAAAALVAPAVPWVLWLFPASIPEAGWLRASLWPGTLLALFAIAWAGGAHAARLRRRSGGRDDASRVHGLRRWLRFHAVSDLRVALDWRERTAALGPFSLAGVEQWAEPRPRYTATRWRLAVNWPAGSIEFESSRFTQALWGRAVMSPNQFLEPGERVAG